MVNFSLITGLILWSLFNSIFIKQFTELISAGNVHRYGFWGEWLSAMRFQDRLLLSLKKISTELMPVVSVQPIMCFEPAIQTSFGAG